MARWVLVKTKYKAYLPLISEMTSIDLEWTLSRELSWSLTIVSDAWICKTCSALHLKEAWITWHRQTNWKNQSVIVNILHRLEGVEYCLQLQHLLFVLEEVIFKDRWISMSWPSLWVWGGMGWGCELWSNPRGFFNLQSVQCTAALDRGKRGNFWIAKPYYHIIPPTFTHFNLLDGPTWFRSSSRRIIQFNPKHALLIMAHARFCRDWKRGKSPSGEHWNDPTLVC